jgi:hypothetical protein
MARHILVVHTSPVEGREIEYNQWYDNVHIPDVLTVESVVSARRFKAQPSVHDELPDLPYLAIYEIESESLSQAMETLREGAKTWVMSDALDQSGMYAFAYTEL